METAAKQAGPQTLVEYGGLWLVLQRTVTGDAVRAHGLRSGVGGFPGEVTFMPGGEAKGEHMALVYGRQNHVPKAF